MKKTLIAMIVVGLAGCASSAKRDTYDLINAELKDATSTNKVVAATPNTVSNALLPPLQTVRPMVVHPIEERFSVAFNSVPAAQFFTAIAAGTQVPRPLAAPLPPVPGPFPRVGKGEDGGGFWRRRWHRGGATERRMERSLTLPSADCRRLLG